MAGWALAAICGMAGAAMAAYPDKPVTLVVPYPAGGATGTLGRLIADGLAKRLGDNVIVENRGGAGTVIGAAYVAQSAPDGYTLLISSNSSFTLNPALRSDLPYDPLKSFESIGSIGSSPLVLLAHPSLPVQTLPELIRFAKSHPGTLSYASFGIGTSPHFAGEMLKVMAGLDMTHVPYKGEGPAIQDLMGGHVQLSFDTNVTAIPEIHAGKVKAIAVTSAKPSPSLPGVPTIAQSGYPDYEMVPWYAVVAPRGLPVEVKQKLTRALAETLADPAVDRALSFAGLDVEYQPPAAYEARVGKELPLMRAYVHKAKMQVD
jgi:tripartite-type tricarboxylate transporter receptor subunit TctC